MQPLDPVFVKLKLLEWLGTFPQTTADDPLWRPCIALLGDGTGYVGQWYFGARQMLTCYLPTLNDFVLAPRSTLDETHEMRETAARIAASVPGLVVEQLIVAVPPNEMSYYLGGYVLYVRTPSN
jgi:hypothetical protein